MVKHFTLHERVPTGLPAILRELKARNKLAVRDQILSGEFYKKEEKP